MRLIIALVVASVLSLVGCAAATESPGTPTHEPVATADVPAQAPDAPPADSVAPTHTEDFTAACTSTRFTSTGTHVTDGTTGLVWLATDIAYPDSATPPPPSAVCAQEAGFRAATTAEVVALGQAIPGCSLPGLFAPVYAWAPNATSSGPLPITTSDGCVDVKAGVSFTGPCHLAVDVSRSTMCVK